MYRIHHGMYLPQMNVSVGGARQATARRWSAPFIAAAALQVSSSTPCRM